MSTVLEASPALRRRVGVFHVVRGVLLVCWGALLIGVVVLAERGSTLERLDAAVAEGRASSVRLEGGMSPEGTGFATVQVHWREGLSAYTAEVVEVRPPGGGDGSGPSVDPSSTVLVDETVAEHLRALRPDLGVSTVDLQGGLGADLLGFVLGARLALALTLLYLATLALVISGPDPWRATRWAWFWLLTTPLMPMGAIAYLVLAAPAPGLPAPRNRDRRLTGGWALLIALVLGGAGSAASAASGG